MAIPRLSLAHLSALHVPPLDLASAAAAAGFGGIGLRLAPATPGAVSYPLPVGSDALGALRKRLRDEGVVVNDIEFIPLTPEVDIPSFEPMLATGAELGARTLTVSGDDPDRARLTDTFARTCDLAGGYALQVEIEFMVWRHVACLEDAVAVVEGSGAANGAILVDALHLARSGGSPADLAGLPPGRRHGAQLCDAPAESPPTDGIIEEARNRRLAPGEGALPLREFVSALGDRVAYSVEVPMPPGGDLAAHLRRIRASTEGVFADR